MSEEHYSPENPVQVEHVNQTLLLGPREEFIQPPNSVAEQIAQNAPGIAQQSYLPRRSTDSAKSTMRELLIVGFGVLLLAAVFGAIALLILNLLI